MTKKELVNKIGELLGTDSDLSFLLILEREQIETLIACIRARTDRGMDEALGIGGRIRAMDCLGFAWF